MGHMEEDKLKSTLQNDTMDAPAINPLNLGLVVDHATISCTFPQLIIYETQEKVKGISICSLRELPLDIPYWTENNSCLTRFSTSEIKLANKGEEIIVPIPEEEDVPCPGIFVVEGEKPLLLEADEYSAEKMVESLTGSLLFEGIQFFTSNGQTAHKRKKSSLKRYFGWGKSSEPKGVSTGQVLFSLKAIPIDQTRYFSVSDGNPTMATITRISEQDFKINGCTYRSAEVQQVLDDESGFVDYVFPNLSPRKTKPEYGNKKISEDSTNNKLMRAESMRWPRASPYEENKPTKEYLSEGEDDDEGNDFGEDGGEEAGESKKQVEAKYADMMKKFDEKLQNAVKRRQQEKERKMASMMAKYTNAMASSSGEGEETKAGGAEDDNSNPHESSVSVSGAEESEATKRTKQKSEGENEVGRETGNWQEKGAEKEHQQT